MATQEHRRRNPRGQGDRLRADIIEAASRLLADPAAPPLTLRGVARAAGVAATSVYLHFADTDELVLAVADQHFSAMLAAEQAARDAAATPRDAVRAMALAYCDFGLANPGLYLVMFASPLPSPVVRFDANSPAGRPSSSAPRRSPSPHSAPAGTRTTRTDRLSVRPSLCSGSHSSRHGEPAHLPQPGLPRAAAGGDGGDRGRRACSAQQAPDLPLITERARG